MKVQLFFGLPSASLWECIRLLVTYSSVLHNFTQVRWDVLFIGLLH